MNSKTALSITAMLTIAFLSVLYMNTLGLRTDAFDDDRTASMPVQETNGLVVGSKVLLRGVAIGSVTGIVPSADHVDIEWKYGSNYAIPANSAVRLENLSALGEPYVAILPDSTAGPYLGDNARIGEDRITVPTSITELSARLSRLLEQVDPGRIRQIFDELDTGLPDSAPVLQDLSRVSALLASMTTGNEDNIAALFTNAQALLLNSSWLPPGLAGATTDVARFGEGLQGFLGSAYDTVLIAPLPDGIALGTGPFLEDLQSFLDKAAPDIQILATAVLPGVRAAAASIRTVDVSHLLDAALDSTRSGDAVSVRVDVGAGDR